MAITFSLTAEGDVINDYQLIVQVLGEAFPYIDFLKGKTLVIKLGGSTLEHQRGVLQDIIWLRALGANPVLVHGGGPYINERSEEHTSELQSREKLVCRLLLEKKQRTGRWPAARPVWSAGSGRRRTRPGRRPARGR